MSTLVPAVLQCPCGAELRVPVVDGLNPGRRTDLRRAILEGGFHRFACLGCGRTLLVEKLFAYLDFERRQLFTVFPEADIAVRGERLAFAHRTFHMTMEANAPPIVRSWAPEFTRRVVFGLAALRETIVTFDAGLDDRIVQRMKLDLLGELGFGYDPGAWFYLTAREPSGALRFEHAGPGEARTIPMVVAFEEYEALAAQPTEVLRGALRALHLDIAVDYRIAFVADRSRSEAEPPPLDFPAWPEAGAARAHGQAAGASSGIPRVVDPGDARGAGNTFDTGELPP